MSNSVDAKAVAYYWDQSWKGLEVFERGVRLFRFSLIGLRAFGISTATTELLIKQSGLVRSGIFAILIIQDVSEAVRGNLPESSKLLHRLRDGAQVVLDLTTTLDFLNETKILPLGRYAAFCAGILNASWLFYKAYALDADCQVWESQTEQESKKSKQAWKVASTSVDCIYAVEEIFFESSAPDLLRGAIGIAASVMGGSRAAWEFRKKQAEHGNSL